MYFEPQRFCSRGLPLNVEPLCDWANAVVEACSLLPRAVAAVATAADNSVFLILTEEFQRGVYLERPWVDQLLAGVVDAGIVWENWRSRDALFTQLVEEEANSLDMTIMVIDGTRGVLEVAAHIARETRCAGA